MAGKSRLIALNAGLVVALGLIAWQGRVRWQAAQAERRASLNVPMKRIAPTRALPAPTPEAVQAAKYADIATKNLFSKDRNPTVIVDAPEVEAPKPMPPLPVVYGVIALPSGTKALMAERAGSASRAVSAGDSVGEFKILALDTAKVTFEWNGKSLERSMDDLVDHSGATATAGGPAAAAGPAAPPAPVAPPTTAALGADTGTAEAPTKACKQGETSPVGTVVDGYKKTGVMSPFGLVGCSWVLSK